ncbi:MAG TPA: carboxypeptidase regulatory-like domain-containing protein [Candidatus Acidoferrum sp.]|nr:carboxypeptidase regulatory-like domain-containing protein [Candidatus Acidoferrum sp.]
MKDAKRLQQLQSVCCKSILFSAVLALLSFLLSVPILNAQSTGGRVRGTVTDASGGAVAGVKVSLVNTATNISRESVTSATGEYLFLEVPVGGYEIDINQTGFKKYVRKDIAVDLNAVVGVDITLQVGGSTEVVEVTGAPPVVDTTSTQLGAVVNERSSTQLPLNQRDVYQLLQLQPGVQSQLGNDLFYGSDKAGVVTVNGGRGRSNNYTVNGGDGNDLFANIPAVEPSPDSIEEFRVISNSFDAEYGRNSGAVVNVVTKSGTNDLHGSFYEFFRNDVLNSHPFTFTESPKPAFKQNQFGGTVGGPIRKDKTFFFGSYEGRRIVQGVVSQPVTVPTGAQESGDFSSGATFTGSLFDPTVAGVLQDRCGTGSTLPANQKLSPAAQTLVAGVAGGGAPVPYSTIFTGNQIPTGCFDPVAVSLLQYVPGSGGAASQVVTVPKKRDRGDQFQIKVDHAFNSNQKTAIYYYFDDDNFLDPFAKFQAEGAPLGNFPGIYATRTQQINGSHTSTIGASAVNELRITYFREAQMKFDTPLKTNKIQDSCGTGPASAFCFTGVSDSATINAACAAGAANVADCGIHSGLPNPASVEGVPFVQLNGGFSIGNNFGGQLPQTGNTLQVSDNYSKIIGNHSFKFGGDVRYQKFDQLLYFDINGQIVFNSDSNICGPANPETVNCSPVTGSDVGSDSIYPNYFLGLTNSYIQGSAQHELVRSTSVYLFAQDSWKIKPSLTLNYGVRWEVNTPLTDIGKKVQTFHPGQRSTIYPCSLDPSNPLFAQFGPGEAGCDAAGVTPVGLVFPGDKGVPSGLTNTYYKSFAPRLGLNWSPGARDGWLAKLTGGPSKTSITMGYGIFYNPIEQLVLEQFSAEPPFGGSNFIGSSFLGTPYVDQTGAVFSNPFKGILNPPRGTALDWSNFAGSVYFGQFPANMRSQYQDQYNLTIKRELPGNMLLQLAYVGSQGHRLLATYEVNPGNPNTCNDLAALGQGCGPFGEDSPYQFTLPAGQVFHLPYVGGGPNGQNIPCSIQHPSAACVITGQPGGTPITLVGTRLYSSPLCNPLTGTGCPVTGVPPFSGIFSEDTIAHSNYNSFQALFEKRFSHGVQFQAAYTFSKSLDNASSFESALNPLNFNATYGLSNYDARHRFVVNYVWDLPIPKYDGFKGALLNGWEASGILSFQSGFPIRITSQDDVEELDTTFDFEAPGQPNYNTAAGFIPGHFVKQDIRKNGGFVFDPNEFTNSTVAPGTIGNAPRSICCGPGINNWDMSFSKSTPIKERLRMEFRADIFNVWNHAQFYTVDGNISNQGSTFGQVLHVRDPRLVQFALKFKF